MRSVVALLVIAVVACGHGGKRTPVWPDAPMQLRDESDRDQAIDQLWVLPHGAQRDRVRMQITNAIRRLAVSSASAPRSS